jgi:hypothetical protein
VVCDASELESNLLSVLAYLWSSTWFMHKPSLISLESSLVSPNFTCHYPKYQQFLKFTSSVLGLPHFMASCPWQFSCFIPGNCIQDVDSEVLQHLKRLGRKDPTTKVRLLIRFILLFFFFMLYVFQFILCVLVPKIL